MVDKGLEARKIHGLNGLVHIASSAMIHRIIIAREMRMAMPSFPPPARPDMNIQWLVVREIHRVSGKQEERNQKDKANLGHQI